MEEILWNVMAMSGERIQTRGRSLVRACKARVVMAANIKGLVTVAAVPLHMNQWSKEGLLLLDKKGRPVAKESFRDGHSNAQIYMPAWPEGPLERGFYINKFEQFARYDWFRSLSDGDRPRPAFYLRDAEEVARELCMRVVVDPGEIEYPEAEELLLGSCGDLQSGKFDILPNVVHGEDGKRTRLKVTSAAVVTKVTKEAVTVKYRNKQYDTFPTPEGMAAHKRIRPGRKIKRGQALFRLDVKDQEGLIALEIAQVLCDAVRAKMIVQDHDRQLVRLGFATKVAHHCLRCGSSNGVWPIVDLICPGCGSRVDSARRSDTKQHLRAHEVKPDTELECVRCRLVRPAESFRKHRVCEACGAAAVPALKKAYVACNTRHYASSPISTGVHIPNPVDISFVKSYFRRLQKEGTTPEQLLEERGAVAEIPATTLVA